LSLFTELKRRNVLRIAGLYLVGAWLSVQVAGTVLPMFDAPAWLPRTIVIVLAIGFIPALIFAWAFELTPEGLKREKDVDRSGAGASHTGKALDRIIMVVLALALGYFAFDKFVLSPQREAEQMSTARKEGRSEALVGSYGDKSIAVLPFVDMSADKDQEYFADGIAEELLNLLAKIPQLRVISRSSAFSFKGQNLDIPEIGKRLNVAHILEGSVRKAGNQVRITAQLIEARSDTHLWSETYDRPLDNIFAVQDEIAVAVVDALKITLLGEAPKVRETDPKAYQLFLEGQYFRYQVSEATLPKAIDLFKQAVEIDPAYAPAWAELSFSYAWYGSIGGMPIDKASALADAAAEKALAADPNYGWAYFARGASRIFNKFDFKAGNEDYRHALQLDPGNAFLIAATGTGARVIGHFDEAIAQYTAALELDPVVPEVHNFLGLVYLYTGRLGEAEQAYRMMLSLSPLISGGHYRVGRVLLRQGNLQGAVTEMQSETSHVYHDTGLAMVQHALGNTAESEAALQDLIENAAGDAAFQIAEVYGYRDQSDKAFEWLEQSLLIRDSGLASILGDPALRDLRTDPRWQPFLEKLGLLEFWLEMPPEYGGPIGRSPSGID